MCVYVCVRVLVRDWQGERDMTTDGSSRLDVGEENIAAQIGVGSLSLLKRLNQAEITLALTDLIMRHENAPRVTMPTFSSCSSPSVNI